MAKSNNKKNRTDGMIPMKNKKIPIPTNSTDNISASFDYNPDREHINRVSKTNQLY